MLLGIAVKKFDLNVGAIKSYNFNPVYFRAGCEIGFSHNLIAFFVVKYGFEKFFLTLA
jgi:hypothetical protein